MIGEGHTRRAWELPFGLVLKLERHDPEPRWAHNASYLNMRRRVAAFTELALSMHLPLATPRIFAALFAFGKTPQHPTVTIVERVTPLPGDRDSYIDFNDVYV